MTNDVLNRGQQAGADAFFNFLMTDAKIFTISGSAGTGKTFLTRHLISVVMKKYEASCHLFDIKPEFDEVAFTATTNKAAEVLEQALGLSVMTIHSFLGLKVKENYRTGKTFLEKTSSWKLHKRKIVFIDECSMIDKDLYAHILEAMADCKIVFVGDHAQMAPINESISQLYIDVDPAHTAFLTEPVRNAGQPALVALCTQLRETVETGIFRPIEEVPGVIDYVDQETMPEGLDHYFKDPDPSCRVLAYTNVQVGNFNQYIREDVRNLPPELQEGDVLVVNQAFSRGRMTLSVEREVQVHKVSDVLENEQFFSLLGETIPYRNVGLSINGSSAVFDDIPVACDPGRVTTLVKRLAQQKRWGDYFDLKNSFLDIQPKAACTVYKAQGSTYDAVFVDLGNIGTSYSPEQVARMLFVGISRAKTRVFLFGRLHGPYHNSKGQPLWKQDPTLTALLGSSSKRTEQVLENS